MRTGFSATEILFDNRGFTYVLYEAEEIPDDDSPTSVTFGIDASSEQKRNVGPTLVCEPRGSDLDWPTVEGYIPCDEGEGLPNYCHDDPL